MISAVYWPLLAIVTLAPLPYGSVHLWSYSLLALLTGLLAAGWGVAAALNRAACPVPVRRYAVPGVLYALVLVWIGLQACPLMPASWHHPLWTDARAALGDVATSTISVDPAETLLVLMRLATYGAVFFLFMQLGSDRKRASRALWALALAGIGYAVYGLAVQASGSQTILLAEKWAYKDVLTSTLVNRNHYAIYAGLGLIVCLGLLIREARRDARGAFLDSAILLRSVERLSLSSFVFAAGCVAIALALLLTQSRGGAMFTAIALVALIAALNRGGRLSNRASLIFVLAMLAGGVLLVAFSGDGILLRMIAPSSTVGRGEIHALTEQIIAAAPWTGHGAGTFPHLFHLYRGEAFPAISPSYASAHSVYLEMAAEIGVVAAVLFFSAIAWIVAACALAIPRRHRGVHFPAIAVAASVLIGLHSTVDFGAQIPGIAVAYAALLGIGYAQARPRGDDREEEERPDIRRLRERYRDDAG